MSIDEPPQVAARRRGIRYLTRLTLEPASAPEPAHVLLARIAGRLCDRLNGLVDDPQAGLPASRSVDLIQMNWWLPAGPLTTRDGAVSLFRLLEATAPEFLPRRYGDCEPPRHRFEPGVMDHFLDLLFDHRLLLFVWRAAKHGHVHYSPASGPAWRWLPGLGDHGYVVPRLTIGCPGDVLSKPAGEDRLRELWTGINALGSPMYADVRLLRGYHRRGNQITASARSESHPIRGGWRGLPKTLGLAFALGSPYLSHWPAIQQTAPHDAAATLSVPEWARGGEITDICGPPPDVLVAPEGQLAPYWPFTPKPATRD